MVAVSKRDRTFHPNLDGTEVVALPAAATGQETVFGYCISNLNLPSDTKYLTVNHYDNYGFLGANGFPVSGDSLVVKEIQPLVGSYGATAVTLAENSYDAIGRLISTGRANNASFATNVGYNLRSWVTSYGGPVFNETIKYVDGTVPQYGGNMVFKDGVLDKTLIEGGYIDAQNRYHFLLKDHLGNVKVDVLANGTVGSVPSSVSGVGSAI